MEFNFQVSSLGDELTPFSDLDLLADEEQRKRFVVQMNTLQHNLQLNIAQDQHLSKIFASRFQSRTAAHQHTKTKHNIIPRRGITVPSPSNGKFKVDHRPLSQRLTECVDEGGISMLANNPAVPTSSTLKKATLEYTKLQKLNSSRLTSKERKEISVPTNKNGPLPILDRDK